MNKTVLMISVNKDRALKSHKQQSNTAACLSQR